MVTRRQVITTIGAGTVGTIAGCGCKPLRTYDVALAVDSIDRRDDGWDVEVTTTVTFFDVDREQKGIQELELAAYDRDRTVLGTVDVGAIRWEDVPEAERSDDDCGARNEVSVTRTLSAESIPYYVGPRFPLPTEVAEFDRARSRGFGSVDALRYGADDAAESTDGTDRPGSDDGIDDERTDDGVDDAWPPDSISPGAYRSVRVDSLPWPEPDEQAIYRGPGLAEVRFETASTCADGRSAPSLASPRYVDADFRIRWDRAVEDVSCIRPFLESAVYDEGTVTIEVGLTEVSYALCRDCRYLAYTVLGTLESDVDGTVSEAVVKHVTAEGELRERVVLD